MPERTQKLIALRARTDHDLWVLVQRELSRGLAALGAATIRRSPAFTQADRAYQMATTLLPKISGLSQPDRLNAERKLAKLRFRLDQVPMYANVSPFRAAAAS